MQQLYDMWLKNRNHQSDQATATPAPSAAEKNPIMMPTDYPELQVDTFVFSWNWSLKTPPLTKKCPVPEPLLLPSVRQEQQRGTTVAEAHHHREAQGPIVPLRRRGRGSNVEPPFPWKKLWTLPEVRIFWAGGTRTYIVNHVGDYCYQRINLKAKLSKYAKYLCFSWHLNTTKYTKTFLF